jgi:hypothetical protein
MLPSLKLVLGGTMGALNELGSFAPDDRVDHRNTVAAITTGHPVPAEFRAAFLHSKSHMIRTHPLLDLHSRERMVTAFASNVGPIDPPIPNQPVPGGVGYGTFYTPAFKTAFDTGTELLWGAVSPAQAGGNVSSVLYITATNRASGGVEALIAYSGAGQLSFRIYDWARPEADRWAVNVPYGSLSQYLQAEAYQGQNYPVLPIWNSTARNVPGNWRNSVYLFDRMQSKWALVYQYDYIAPDASQKNGWPGSWGPIIETFQSAYSGSNPMGALGVQLRARDANSNWSAWSRLAVNEAVPRTDPVGFRQSYLDPYFNWVVTS